MAILSKIFGDANKIYLAKTKHSIEKINSLEKEFEGVSKEGLKEKTNFLKERLQKG